MEIKRIKVNQNFQEPVIDKKIDGVSWLVKMTIKNYLEMVDLESNIYQRNLQSLSFYRKLMEDLLDDTTMPAISVVYPEKNIDLQAGLRVDKKFIILDGLQRTNCILECRDMISKGKSSGIIQSIEEFDQKQIYVEIWEKMDLKNILYKMVVLNTGQKKMDYGHQLDILSESIKEKLEEADIPYYTVKDKAQKKKDTNGFELSIITQSLVSFINATPIPSKKNAAEYLFERFNLNIDDNKNGLALITDDATYEYLKWVLVDFNRLLEEHYPGRNPLQKYDAFIVSLFASLGYCQKKNPENLKRKIKELEKLFASKEDPINLNVFDQLYTSFKTSIGDKRRRFIYGTFREYFLAPTTIDNLEWESMYDRVN
ncbi:hypothetical protein [Bacillus cereus]|uniref:hypothetical protein n=1 Tax=Bacillus cereus TaxID=1396 RepID=UPI0011236188|nr:hypothetical protein [Bacillus cereus]MCH5460920.1 hypothetical protein [Bacillus cereus]TNO60865.1 hypothetical protein FHR06_27440 [Bacillus cereus]